MIKILISLVVILTVSPMCVFAGDLHGEITVLRKNSTKALKSFENTVVFIKGLKVEATEEVFQLDQKGKQFSPRLSVIQAGQTIHFTNNDKVKHNVFSKDLNFDLGYLKHNEVVSKVFDNLGMYKIYCNIHIGMIADLLIVENPFYALTDKKGNFIIKDIPEGDYTLAVHHIYGGQTEIPITIDLSNDPVAITLHSTQVVREIKDHLNKDGMAYSTDDDYDY